MKSHSALWAAAALVGAAISLSPAAQAASYVFSINGDGITASGEIQVDNTGTLGVLGASTVTGITGTFTDANKGYSGAITGLEYAPSPDFSKSPASAPNTFNAPAFTDAGFSYDNLFWPGADSPAVCFDALIFSGGFFDIYGMAFDIAGGDTKGGYTADLWSNGALGGYQLNDSFGGTPSIPSNFDGLAYAVNVTATPTPEPASLLLLGTALPALGVAMRRRFRFTV